MADTLPKSVGRILLASFKTIGTQTLEEGTSANTRDNNKKARTKIQRTGTILGLLSGDSDKDDPTREEFAQDPNADDDSGMSFDTKVLHNLDTTDGRADYRQSSVPINLRVQCLKKKFYFHFQDYIDLIIWKVQFLDRHHLLIKFGSVDGAVSRNTDSHPSFLAVYNMETTEIVAFYQFVKKMMASLPFSCQSQSPSPYFDQSLFRFDEKVWF
ncbi:Light-mediated development protein DET1 [Capsicum annuum]|nr:Light-mediated development protein DET1 [Capsicum annuum]KAF3685201.1 Light-mediated development protein DET1 [Capsicum annuum]